MSEDFATHAAHQVPMPTCIMANTVATAEIDVASRNKSRLLDSLDACREDTHHGVISGASRGRPAMVAASVFMRLSTKAHKGSAGQAASDAGEYCRWCRGGAAERRVSVQSSQHLCVDGGAGFECCRAPLKCQRCLDCRVDFLALVIMS
jgi:hypothetical protein